MTQPRPSKIPRWNYRCYSTYIAENMPEYGFLIETHFSALAQNRRFYHYTGKHGSEKTRILYIWCSVMVLLSCQSTSEKTSNSHKAICVG